MYIAGVTDDNRHVIGDVGTFCFTHGIPLDTALSYFKQKNLVIDWINYIQNSLADGHRVNTIRSRVNTAVADVYGKTYFLEFSKRFDTVLGIIQ